MDIEKNTLSLAPNPLSALGQVIPANKQVSAMPMTTTTSLRLSTTRYNIRNSRMTANITSVMDVRTCVAMKDPEKTNISLWPAKCNNHIL